MSDEPEPRAPLTIKNFPVEARKLATACATKRGETMGDWFARAVRNQARLEAGDRIMPPVVQVAAEPAAAAPAVARGPAALLHTVELLRETRAVFAALGRPMPDALVKEIERLARARMREERGIAPARPRRRLNTIDGELASRDDLGPTGNENSQTLRLPHKETV
jgi:hypothetical protein